MKWCCRVQQTILSQENKYVVQILSSHTGIREEIVNKPDAHYSEICARFNIETSGGSVSRGEDTPESDIDVFYEFLPEMADYNLYLDHFDYLEKLLGRRVELVSVDSMPERIKKAIEVDMFSCNSSLFVTIHSIRFITRRCVVSERETLNLARGKTGSIENSGNMKLKIPWVVC